VLGDARAYPLLIATKVTETKAGIVGETAMLAPAR
jgi:hypothetical protein